METIAGKTVFCKKLTRQLASYRIALGISSNKVRRKTDIDVNKIENCESNVTVYTLYALLGFYGESLSDFFKELEQEIMTNGECTEKKSPENSKQK
jgi:hypothetical protein